MSHIGFETFYVDVESMSGSTGVQVFGNIFLANSYFSCNFSFPSLYLDTWKLVGLNPFFPKVIVFVA